MVAAYRSEPLHKAIVAQRSIKSAEEIADIERAVGVSREMYLTAMAAAKPGKHEYEVVAEIIRVAKMRGCDLSFPIICSVHGETLHNHHHANLMQAGDVMVLDSRRRDAEQERQRHHAHHPGGRDVHRAAAR